MQIDPHRVMELMTARVAQTLGRPAAEAMRDAAMLQAQLEAQGQEDDE